MVYTRNNTTNTKGVPTKGVPTKGQSWHNSSGCLVSLSSRPRCLVSLSCQDILFLISFLDATSRCLLLSLPLAVLSTALSESVVPWLLLLCYSLLFVVLSNCLVISVACLLASLTCMMSHCWWPLIYVVAVLGSLSSVSTWGCPAYPACLNLCELSSSKKARGTQSMQHLAHYIGVIWPSVWARWCRIWFDTIAYGSILYRSSIVSINKLFCYTWISRNLVLIVITIRVPESTSKALPK